MGEAGFARLVGSWRLISVQFRMSDNGEVIDEPIEGFGTFDANGRWTVIAIPSNLGGRRVTRSVPRFSTEQLRFLVGVR